MAKIPADVLDWVRRDPKRFPMPFEPMHGWRSAPDDGGHTHCQGCSATIERGDLVVGRYLEFISIVFCPTCVADNPEQFREWLAVRPK
jgi:hypothetical protein